MARNRDRAIYVLQEMARLFPDAECELIHRNAFELAIAVLLSAQATDVSVNKITPALFARYPSAKEMSLATTNELESAIKTIGLFRNKAKSMLLLSKELMVNYGGEIPNDFDALVSLPGIGRKSANVILSVWFHVPAFAVDTHVERVSKRLQFCKPDDSVLEVERRMCRFIPKEQWNDAHHYMIFFGRYLCKAAKPECERCPLQEECLIIKQRRKEETKQVRLRERKTKKEIAINQK